MKYTIDLQPKETVLDGSQLIDLVQLWIDEQGRRHNVAPITVTGYRNNLAYFVEWWQQEGPTCAWEMTRTRMHSYARWLESAKSQYGKPLSYNSRFYCVRRLRQCLRWAYEYHYFAYDITGWVPTPAGSAPIRERATLDELAGLMMAAGRSGEPIRDQALVAIYVGTGLRKMEAVMLDIEDLRMNADQSGTAVIRRAKRVRGRAVQARMIAFDRWTGHYLGRLIDSYQDQRGPLFRVVSGERITAMAAYRAVKKAIRRAGLEERIEGPHDLRRNFATWFSRKHRGEMHGRLLSKQLGHAHFKMTDSYILHDADDLAAVIESPLAEFTMPTQTRARADAIRRRGRGRSHLLRIAGDEAGDEAGGSDGV